MHHVWPRIGTAVDRRHLQKEKPNCVAFQYNAIGIAHTLLDTSTARENFPRGKFSRAVVSSNSLSVTKGLLRRSGKSTALKLLDTTALKFPRLLLSCFSTIALKLLDYVA